MSRKAVATPETVTQAVESLRQEGLEPTVDRIRTRLGGGSFTTISRALSAIRRQQGLDQVPVGDMPPDLAQIGQQALQGIYAAIQRTARTQIEAIEREARLQVQAAEKARSEAELEIERLERQADATDELIGVLRTTSEDLRAKTERIEGQLAEVDREAEKSRTELATLGTELKAAREDAAEQRGRLSADLERAKTEITRLREQLKLQQVKRSAGSEKSHEAVS
jgi:Plasmid replication region DNA-binding N-term